jgi:hypothetical protein
VQSLKRLGSGTHNKRLSKWAKVRGAMLLTRMKSGVIEDETTPKSNHSTKEHKIPSKRQTKNIEEIQEEPELIESKRTSSSDSKTISEESEYFRSHNVEIDFEKNQMDELLENGDIQHESIVNFDNLHDLDHQGDIVFKKMLQMEEEDDQFHNNWLDSIDKMHLAEKLKDLYND